ncbi:MAG: OsmC family protein [Planctomycetota bacterium]
MSDQPVTVRLGAEKFRNRITARQHSIYGDEPGSLGGADSGPTPYELLLAAVGSCKAITARMYAERKGWKLDAVDVELEHDRSEGRGGPEVIRVALRFEGDLDDEQRRRLLEIAEKCPVQKTITGELSVSAALRDS